jgi:hypothetical protein
MLSSQPVRFSSGLRVASLSCDFSCCPSGGATASGGLFAVLVVELVVAGLM